jgi:hypothetical protein
VATLGVGAQELHVAQLDGAVPDPADDARTGVFWPRLMSRPVFVVDALSAGGG